MALKYHLVLRKDLSKGAAPEAKLYHGQVRSVRVIEFDHLCDLISDNSTASKGDVHVVIAGLTRVMQRGVGFGDVFRLGELGSFRMVAGSSGAATKEDFNVALFKKGRIVFTPGPALKKLEQEVKFEKGGFAAKSADGGTDGGDTGGGGIEELDA
jgi:predicted histone-like DNA-binding protein